MESKVTEVETWEAFRHLIDEHSPSRIIYNIKRWDAQEEGAILSFTIPLETTQYVFTDSVVGARLRETKILLRRDKRGNTCVKDEDVLKFVRSNISRKRPKLISSWTHARGREKLVSAGVILLGSLSETRREKLEGKGEFPEDLESLMARARALLEKG